MINEFKATLQKFVNKKCKLAEVTQQLESLLNKHPQLAEPIDGQIKQLAASNKVPQDACDAIRAVTAEYLSTESGDKTVISGDNTSATAVTDHEGGDLDKTQVDPAAGGDFDKTQVNSGGSAEPVDEDATEIGTDLPPSSTITSATQTDDGFGLDLDATGGDPNMTSPTIGPDGMPVMTHGDKIIGIGSVLRNRFELTKKLGEGGMGAVYMALDKIKLEAQDKNDKVAVKVLNETFKQFRESFIALQRESSKQQKLAHPNIATVFDFDRDYTYDTVFMTMEMMDGEPLDDYIKHRVPPEGLSYEDSRFIIDGMCDGLSYAHHHNLVHSDFKPANTFVLKSGVVKLLDFGIARAAKPKLDADGNKEATLFDPGSLGALTPAYASAEMLEGETPEPPDDIYALACVSYQLLGGKHPFNKMPANQARDNKLKPAPIKKLNRRQMKGLLKGLEFDRKKRTQTVEEFLDAITPKKPIAAYIAAGSVVILSIIGFLSWGQVEEYYRTERVKATIASFTSAAANRRSAEVKALLQKLETDKENFDEQSVAQIKADSGVQKAIVGYFSRLADRQIDKTKGKYNYPAAYQILSEAKTHYRDSGKIQNKKEEIDNKKAEELEIQGDQYRLLTTIGPWLPIEEKIDVPEVIQTIKTIEPDNKLLTDARLVGSYLKQIKAAREDKKFQRAENLIDQAKQFTSKQTALINEKAELDLAKFSAGNLELLSSLSRKVNQSGATSNLNKALAVSKELRQMRVIAPDDSLLATASKTASAGLIKALKTAKGKTAVNNIAQQFLAIGPALSASQQDQVRTELNKAWKQSGGIDSTYSTQLKGKTSEVTDEIAAINSKAEFSHEWTQSLKQLVGELQALVGNSHVSVQQTKRKIAVQHMQRATKASEQNQLAESRIQIAYAKDFDEQAPGLVKAENIIRQAFEKEEQAILEEVRLATITALKEDLLSKARSEKINDAKKFLAELKIFLLPRDKFLTTDGPNAIGTAYANIALRTKERADNIVKDFVGQRDAYAAALRQIQEGFKIAPDSKNLADARNQINYSKGVAEVRNIFKTTEKLDVAKLSSQLNSIKNLYPADYGRQRTVFSNDIAERIGTLVVYDPLAAKAFLSAAKRLPINRNILDRIKLPEYRPSKFAKDIRAALGSSLLTKASQILKNALTEESDHPEIKTLRGVLASKTTAAKKLYTQHKALAAKFKLAEAKEALTAALEIWKDRAEYLTSMKSLERVMSKPAAGAAPTTKAELIKLKKSLGVPCAARLAGYGRRKQALCYDGLPGGQAPTLIVLPAGAGHTSPFAITKFEISVKDYNFYCTTSKKCQPLGSRPGLPVTGISLDQAKSYSAWLSEATGAKYSIPTDAEWLHAASVGGKQKKQKKNYNCTLRLGEKLLKGTGLEDADAGSPNKWGLVNHLGNAQEWVEDSSGIKVRGGAFSDTMQKCTIDLQRPHNGNPDKITTFRLVKKLN